VSSTFGADAIAPPAVGRVAAPRVARLASLGKFYVRQMALLTAPKAPPSAIFKTG